MGYGGRPKKIREPCQVEKLEAELIYYSEGTKRSLYRDWLQTHAVKSTPRDYEAVLWLDFEPPRRYNSEV